MVDDVWMHVAHVHRWLCSTWCSERWTLWVTVMSLNPPNDDSCIMIHDVSILLSVYVCCLIWVFALFFSGLVSSMLWIEDDMTYPLDKKRVVLLQFHEMLYQMGWTFSECKSLK